MIRRNCYNIHGFLVVEDIGEQGFKTHANSSTITGLKPLRFGCFLLLPSLYLKHGFANPLDLFIQHFVGDVDRKTSSTLLTIFKTFILLSFVS